MRHSNQNIQNTYECFVERIQQISKLKKYSSLEALQALARIREKLVQLLESYNDSDSLQSLLIRSSLSLVNFEKQMIYLQLKYPGIREMPSEHHHSPLKISKNTPIPT